MEVEFENADSKRYKKAKKKVVAIREFYYNLTCYCVVIPILAAVNITYMPDFLWFFFSLIGWGIGLVFHAIGAFDIKIFGRKWEERKLQEILERERNRNQSL